MDGVNKAIVLGRLGKDPELKYTPSGVAVANFSVATSESWKDKETGEKRENTQWHRLVAWRRLGEVCGEFLKKGSLVFIEGKMETRSWEDQDGNKRWTTEVIAQKMQMLGGKRDQEPESEPATPPPEPPASSQGSFLPEDDVPF